MVEYFLIGSLCMAFGFVAGLITAETLNSKKYSDDEWEDEDCD